MNLVKLLVTLSLVVSLAACSSNRAVRSSSVTDIGSFERVSEELASGVQSTVYFDYNSSKITDQYKLIAEAQAEWLIKNNIKSIVIAGYCDERGTREYNMALGARRADALKSALVTYGVDKKKIKVVSYGKDQPNPRCERKMQDEDGYQSYLECNRRAVVTVE